MRDLQKFASALRRLAEGSPSGSASCPLGNGLRITVQHEDTPTGERVYQLSASSHVAPQPDDLHSIAEAFGTPAGSEWNWQTKNDGKLHIAMCRWHERCAAEEPAV